VQIGCHLAEHQEVALEVVFKDGLVQRGNELVETRLAVRVPRVQQVGPYNLVPSHLHHILVDGASNDAAVQFVCMCKGLGVCNFLLVVFVQDSYYLVIRFQGL